MAAARRAVDLALAAVCLCVLLVPFAVLAVLIRLDSPGPALFRQERIGRDGRPFVMYKFRSMRAGSDDASLRTLIARELAGEDTVVDGSCKLDADPRVTGLGRWLRRTSVDELPQLINVARGEMSLVGPRPCLPWEAEMFPAQYQVRHRVRPGMTGLWQVSGRSNLPTLDMLALDVEYIRTRSLRGDLGILLRTAPALLRRNGAR